MKKIISLFLALALLAVVPMSLTSCGEEYQYAEMSVKNYGKVIIKLDPQNAPVTVENFVNLVNEGFYDGLTFHRIIKDFMIQGGASATGDYATGIYGEFSSNGHDNNIQHVKGVISMARTPNDPNSATTQFFICNSDARESLDGEYAAFGYVIEGLDVIDRITEDIFPKTRYASYYKDQSMDSYYYGYTKHQVWSQLGNGFVENESDMPVIEYIKIIDYNA